MLRVFVLNGHGFKFSDFFLLQFFALLLIFCRVFSIVFCCLPFLIALLIVLVQKYYLPCTVFVVSHSLDYCTILLPVLWWSLGNSVWVFIQWVSSIGKPWCTHSMGSLVFIQKVSYGWCTPTQLSISSNRSHPLQNQVHPLNCGLHPTSFLGIMCTHSVVDFIHWKPLCTHSIVVFI